MSENDQHPSNVEFLARGKCIECQTSFECSFVAGPRLSSSIFMVPDRWAQIIITVKEPTLPESAQRQFDFLAERMSKEAFQDYVESVRASIPPFEARYQICPACMEKGITPKMWEFLHKDIDRAVNHLIEDQVRTATVLPFPGVSPAPDAVAPDGDDEEGTSS